MVRKNAESARKEAEKVEESVAVAIDKDKGSQYALKWAVDHLLTRGQSVTLLHVKQKAPSIHAPSNVNEDVSRTHTKQLESEARELFLPFRCFCTRKDIRCKEVVVEDVDVSKAIIDYAASHIIETLILGATTRGGLIVRKFKTTDVPSIVSKAAPDFCTVYVINKGKVSSVRSASAPPPPKPPLQIQLPNKPSYIPASPDVHQRTGRTPHVSERSSYMSNSIQEDSEMIKSPFIRNSGSMGKSYNHYPPEMDVSYASSVRPTSKRMFPSFHDHSESVMSPQYAMGNDYDDRSFGSMYSASTSIDMDSQYNYSCSSQDTGQTSWHSHNMNDVESEIRRLRLELKQTMDMYNSACREALSAKQKTREYQYQNLKEHRFDEAQIAEEAALALVEKEKAKCNAAIEAAQAAQKLAEMEAQKRMSLEMKALKDSEETKARESWVPSDLRYRRYTIEEIETATKDFSDSLKIGEGGYGPVYRCYLDHTEVAVKVLRADAAQGKSQFQQEVEVLSCIRHPNMVLLLGACPEYGCLVYEHMANGSLDDRLFRRGNTPPLPWQVRFRIAAEIATGLLFLHQTKPEPLVHRDLKPGNILLDRNFVSKISDVGLARLVPPSVADSVTQYRMTSAAGTFCYIDPEYQQTGMLGTKSDIYSLGIMLLQMITAKSPMGLAHLVESSIEDGTFVEVLDPTVPEWPLEDTLKFAKLALQCAELRKKDRPDLGKVILPELNRLRALGEENMPYPMFGGIFSTTTSTNRSHISSLQEVTMSDVPSATDSSSISSSSSYGGRR
ncbi:U-box domain-containing protein 52 [Hevea brasiliensis]|uniref:U-box domain-containing protein 52 n=1 Tax=Hevea brasiliensis TaxID=3981 RepID=UPI0025DD04CE|nr:U-box domain-containing protein 52 [Hevea brasiliensis]